MKAPKFGSRHPLLFYRRTMDRIWKVASILGLLLCATWGWELINTPADKKDWLLAAGIFSLFIGLLAFIFRYTAYVQAKKDHLNVVTPFIRLKVSYRRVRSIHPILIQQLFPKNESSWSQRNFLAPFHGKTAVVVELKGYPLPPLLLRLFIPSQMFSPQSEGLVFLVPDWMKLSTEIDSFYGSWLQRQGGISRGNSRR